MFILLGRMEKVRVRMRLQRCFRLSDYKVGLYTSPHLKSFRERIKINGHQIDQNSIIDFVKKHKDIIKVISPSFFEMTVAMAFDYFASRR